MSKKAKRNYKQRASEHIKAEGVDWSDALRHAMNKPKPKRDWNPKKK